MSYCHSYPKSCYYGYYNNPCIAFQQPGTVQCNPYSNQCPTPCPTPCPSPPPAPQLTCPNIVYRAGLADPPQVLPTSVITTLNTFTAVQLNVGGITFNPANGYFTVPTSGRYLIYALLSFDINTSGTRESTINYINSANTINISIAADSRLANGTYPTRVTMTAFYDMNAGDSFYIQVYQDSGVPLGMISPGSSSLVSITRLCGPSS